MGAGAIAARVDISTEADIVQACREGRSLAQSLGFAGSELAYVVTAISEIAGNVWRHAGQGHIELERAEAAGRLGIAVRAIDRGPGIADLDAAMRDGWSPAGSMGLGLPGARRLMDEFEIASEPGRGTTVTMTRWRASPATAGAVRLVDWGTAPAPAPAGRRAVVRPFRGGVLVAALSASGEGRAAGLAVEMAAAELERHASESPIALVERCHRALGGDSGTATAIAVASLSALDSRMTWLALGAVAGVLVRRAGRRPTLSTAPHQPGTAGGRLPSLRAATLSVAPDDTLVLAAGRALPPALGATLAEATPQRAAEQLLCALGDGGLAVVARRR